MTATRVRLDAITDTYSQKGKTVARTAAVALAKHIRARTILDLWGGGESARLFRREIPDAAVITAETERSLWPILQVEAQREGYGFHLGDVANVQGTFDFIWLDLCGQAGKETERLVKEVRRKLNGDGLLAITILPARESESWISGEQRLRLLPMWLEQVTGLSVRFFLPYRRTRNLPMWLIVLGRGQSWWSDRRASDLSWHTETVYDLVVEDIEGDGYWSHPGLGYPDYLVLDKIEAAIAA